MVREAMAWLDRTLPLSAHFPPGEIFREDRLPVPPEALREVLLNAVMHRDYSDPGSYVAVAVFDDRIEVRSSGAAFGGHRGDADAAHIVGPAEPAHRGGLPSDRRGGGLGPGHQPGDRGVRAHGIEPPTFERGGGGDRDVPGGHRADGRGRHQVGTKSALSGSKFKFLKAEIRGDRGADGGVGRADRTKFRDQVVRPLLDAGLLEMTIPDKPRSSRQRYRTTEAGRRILAGDRMSDRGGLQWVTFPAAIGPGARGTEQATAQVTEHVTEQVMAMLRAAAEGPASREALQEAAGIKHREHFRKAYLERAMNEGWLERTIPDKPRSPKQRYRTTAAGRRVLSGQV